MLAQLRNGGLCIVIKDVNRYDGYSDFLIGTSTGYHFALNTYNEDLSDIDGESQYDVVKVAECDYVGDAIRGIRDSKGLDDFNDVKVIWERSNPKVAEVETLIGKLQGQLAAAQEELGRLR